MHAIEIESQGKKACGGPLSYDAIRSIRREVVDSIVNLNASGLAWNAIAVMRDVCRITYRYAGGPDGGAVRRNGMSTYRYGLGPVISRPRLQLDLALCLSLYALHDSCLSEENVERDILVDGPALWTAWSVFKRIVPSSTLKIQQVWIGARALLHGSFNLVTCSACDTVRLEGSPTVDSDECHIRGCFVCERRNQHRAQTTVRAQRTARRRDLASRTTSNRATSRPTALVFGEHANG